MLKLCLLLIALQYSQSQNSIWCTDKLCSSCLLGYWHPNNLCLADCPTGDTKSENPKSCSSPTITVLFDINLNNSIPFNAKSISSFSHPLNLSFNDPQKLTPVGTKARGLYFESTSYLQSDQNWIPGPHFRVSIVSRVFQPGILFKLSRGGRTLFKISADSTYYIFTISMSIGDTNFTYTWNSINSGLWVSYLFVCDPSYLKSSLYLNAQRYDIAFGEFRAQMNDIVYSLGGLDQSSFTGFIYSLFAQNRYDFYRHVSAPDNNCLYGQYLYNSVCYTCSSECSTWPACERSSCNLCFSTDCLSCEGYRYNECTLCSTSSGDICGLNFKCTSGSYFNCTSCSSGYELRNGICLLPAYKYNQVSLQTPVIDVKFTKFGKYYDIFQTGSEVNYYPPYDSPDINDPIPCANRGFYFSKILKTYLKTESIVLNHEFTIAYWFSMKSLGNFIYKRSISIKHNIRIILGLANTENPEDFITPSINEKFDIWTFRAHSIKVESYATMVTHYSDTDILIVYSFEGYFLSDHNGTLAIGNFAGTSFEGFFYSFTLWQTHIDDFNSFLYPCGEYLIRSCFWNCSLSQLYALDLEKCINSTTQSGLADIYSGRPGQCAQFNCSKCDSYSSDSNCLIELQNPCYTGLILVGENKCCSSNCLDCDEYFYFKCLQCIHDTYMTGIYCYESCPLGFFISSSSCVISSNLIINANFDQLTGLIKSSPFDITFYSGAISLFYPNFSASNPIPAINRGYYFTTNSFMNSTNFTISYNFTFNLFIKIINDGVVFTKNNLEFSNITSIWSYIGIKMPNIKLNNWSVLAIRVFTDLFGNLYCRVLVDQEVSNYVEQVFGNRLFIDSEQSLQLGSPKNGFTGFIYRLSMYNGDFFESFSNFQICELSPDCISNCSIIEVAINGTCTNCLSSCTSGCVRTNDCNLCEDSKCLICSNFSESCTECNPDLYVNDSKCLCNQGYLLPSEESLICSACDASCYTCDGNLNTNCLSCKENSVLQPDFSCKCEDHYYFTNGSCVICSDQCTTCENFEDFCLSCQEKYEIVNNTCVCKAGYYLKNGDCEVCSVDCQACYNDTHCSECVQGAFLTSEYECKCEDNKYLLNGICQECYDYCLSCEEYGENKCLTCKSDFILVDDGRCKCQDKYFWDLILKKCIECSEFCFSCNNYNETGCIDCSTDCLLCQENTFYKGGKCECISGFFESQEVCQPCDSSCLTCTDKNNFSCTSCETFLVGGMCLKKCPLGYIGENKVCILKSSSGSVFLFDFKNYSEDFLDSVSQLILTKPNFKNFNATAPIPAFDRGIYFNGDNSSLTLENYEDDDIIFSDQFFITLWLNTFDIYGSLLSIYPYDSIKTTLSLSLSNSSIKLIINFTPNQHIFLSKETIFTGQWAFVGLYVSHNSPTSIKFLINSNQEYITDISEIPFMESYNSSYFIGYSKTDLLFFTGFIREFKLSRIFPSTLSSIYSITCDTCSICKSTKTCFSVCQFSEFYDSSTLTCESCRSDCLTGCRYKDSCGLCYESTCLDCTDYNLGSCINCDFGYEAKNGACKICEKTTFYNPLTKLCESCKGLCKTCKSEFTCLSCKDNAYISESSCICSLGYTLSGLACSRIYFSAQITISLDNKATLIFSEPLKSTLSNDQIKVQINEVEYDFDITMNEMSSYLINCKYNQDIKSNTYISIIFIKEITSEKNSLLSNNTLKIQLMPTNNEYEAEKIEKAREVAKQGSATGASISLSLSVLSMDFSSIFNFVSFSEIYSVISLYSLDLPEELLEFLRSVRVQKSIPNVFEKSINADNDVERNPDFVKYGYKGKFFMVNSGVSILFLCGITFVCLIVKMLNPIITPKMPKFSIISEKFNINAFINFWIQSCQELLITSAYGVAQKDFEGVFIVDFCICLGVIVGEILIVLIIIRLLFKRTDLSETRLEIFNKKYQSLVENYKKNKIYTTLFFPVFFIRRILIVVCIFFIPTPTLRLIFSFVLSITHLFYVLSSCCFTSNINNFLHIFNEILTAFLHITLFITLTSSKNILKSNALKICTYIITLSWGLNIVCSLLNNILILVAKIQDYRKSKLVNPEPNVLNTDNISFPDIVSTLKRNSSTKSGKFSESLSRIESKNSFMHSKIDLDVIDLDSKSAK